MKAVQKSSRQSEHPQGKSLRRPKVTTWLLAEPRNRRLAQLLEKRFGQKRVQYLCQMPMVRWEPRTEPAELSCLPLSNLDTLCPA